MIGPEYQRLMRPRGFIILIYFIVNIGAQKGVVEKAVDKEVHVKAGQSGNQEKHPMLKKAYYNSQQVALLLKNQ